MARGLLFSTLPGFRLAFIAGNPSDQLTVIINPIRILIPIIISDGIMVFKRCTTPVIPGI